MTNYSKIRGPIFSRLGNEVLFAGYLVGGSAYRSEGTGREHILDHIVSSHSP